MAASLDRSLGREARALLGGDVELRSGRPLDAAAEAPVRDLARRGAAVTRVRELVAMARNPARGGTLLVELKAVEGGYPLYGRLETVPARPLDELLAGGGVVVEEAVLGRLGLALGDTLAIGDASLTVTGVVGKEPDRAASLFTLGPRVLLNAASLEATGLVRLGSRVRHRTLVRLPAGLEPRAARAALVEAMADPAVRVATFDEAQPGLRRFFDQLTTYLRLVGVTSLLVGGIGVAAAVRAFLARKVGTIAILRCLGASARTLTAVYLVQALALGALGSLAGAVLGHRRPARCSGRCSRPFVPFDLEARAAPGAVATGLLAGCLATLLFALWPLLSARAVPPAILLRHPVDAGTRAAAPALGDRGVVGGGLAALALWQAGPLRVGAIFLGAAAGALGLLALAAWATRRLAGWLPRPRSLAWRHGLHALTRPGSQTIGVTVALGIGVTLLTAVALLERGLTRQLDLERRREAPVVLLRRRAAGPGRRLPRRRSRRSPVRLPPRSCPSSARDSPGSTDEPIDARALGGPRGRVAVHARVRPDVRRRAAGGHGRHPRPLVDRRRPGPRVDLGRGGGGARARRRHRRHPDLRRPGRAGGGARC